MKEGSKRGLFITLEGGEGAGKSSNLSFIQTYLSNKQIELVVTREPGGTPLAEEIRALLLQPRDEKMCENTELLLIFAARAQHIQQVIKPSLQVGQWVLSDRFTDASFAYQGGGRQMNLDTLNILETLVQGELRPDLVILLDVPVEVGMQRAKKRGLLDRFEQEDLAFFERVRASYLQRAKANPDTYAIIDASQSLAHVQEEIVAVLDSLQ
ncbi:MAG TPA: dTMP kinase [Pseudomonadales bacterium]|nr:dTMP kinase [Pseudomonadales bacterium]